MTDPQTSSVPQWGRFEQHFHSSADYANPIQETKLFITFTSPTGHPHRVEGFWDGGHDWRVRFSPNEIGAWAYTSACLNAADGGLDGQTGSFACVSPTGSTRFEQHGGIQLSANRRYLVHADGTPFLWIADTAWNGPLRATPDEWAHYLRERVRQQFTAVQWVTTQWLAAPDGDINGDLAFTGIERIMVNPSFFQRLDQQMDAITAAGLLNIPVLLWAAAWRDEETNRVDPGYSLPDDQAILLARYMVARWSASPVAWILPGDGDYRGAKAERWKRIGHGVFGDAPHTPVSLHPGGMQWNGDEFRNEAWLDILGYQSGHGDDDHTWAWLVDGPPAIDWKTEPIRPIINLEPPYENHIAYQSKTRISADTTRRALYWSMLVAPTAGVTYGGHGVWGWDDGTTTPVAHPGTGIPLPWQQALIMAGAEQIAHLTALFEAIQWWRLIPAPELLARQPGDQSKSRFVAASKSAEGDLIVVYIPSEREITLKGVPDGLAAIWFDPRRGQRHPATSNSGTFTTPAQGDWVLLLTK